MPLMKPTLIAYSTTDGQTLRICERLQAALVQQQLPVQLMPVVAAQTLDMAAFGVVVLGASIRYGRHHPEVYRFVAQHKAAGQPPVLFFSVNAVARKPEKRSAHSNPYVRKFLRQTGWQPQHVAVLAGRIDYPRYGWLDKQIIRLIMWLTGGPSDGRGCHEFTDWQEVEALAQTVAQMVGQTADHSAAQMVEKAPLHGPMPHADQASHLAGDSLLIPMANPAANPPAHSDGSPAAAKGAAESATAAGALPATSAQAPSTGAG